MQTDTMHTRRSSTGRSDRRRLESRMPVEILVIDDDDDDNRSGSPEMLLMDSGTLVSDNKTTLAATGRDSVINLQFEAERDQREGSHRQNWGEEAHHSLRGSVVASSSPAASSSGRPKSQRGTGGVSGPTSPTERPPALPSNGDIGTVRSLGVKTRAFLSEKEPARESVTRDGNAREAVRAVREGAVREGVVREADKNNTVLPTRPRGSGRRDKEAAGGWSSLLDESLRAATAPPNDEQDATARRVGGEPTVCIDRI